MIIDKILAQGEYIEKQDGINQKYIFYFATNDGSLNICFDSITDDGLPPVMTYEQALNWHKSRRERMMGNLLNELKTIILDKEFKPGEESDFFTVMDDTRILNIKQSSIKRLVDYTHVNDAKLIDLGLEQLPIAINIINFFNIMYISNSYFDLLLPPTSQNKNHLHDILKSFLDIEPAENTGLVCYRRDQSNIAKPHQFYISRVFPNLPDEKMKTNISPILARQLLNAVKYGLKKVGDIDTEDNKNSDGFIISINLSSAQLNQLRLNVGLPPLLLPPVSTDSPAAPLASIAKIGVPSSDMDRSASAGPQKTIIFDKILAQGELIFSNDQDATYQRYTFECDPENGSIYIIFHTANAGKFVGTTKEKKEAQKSMRQQMLRRLLDELKILVVPYSNENAEMFNIQKGCGAFYNWLMDTRKLTITDAGLSRIATFANNNQNSLIQLGLEQFEQAKQTLTLLRGMYFRFNQLQIVEFLKKMFSIKPEKLVSLNYRFDQNNTHGKHYQLYLGGFFPNSKGNDFVINISKPLAYQLRMAIKCGIAKLLHKTSIDFIEDTQFIGPGAPEHGLAFNFSEADFNQLRGALGQGHTISVEPSTPLLRPPVIARFLAGHQTPVSSEPSLSYQPPAVSGSVMDSQPNKDDVNSVIGDGMHKKDHIRKYSPATLAIIDELQRIFLANIEHIASSRERKARDISAVTTKYLEIKDINILSELYYFINTANAKEFLNYHENSTYDRVFFKRNTNSWQKLIETIRNHALNILLENIGIEEHVYEAIINGEGTKIMYPREVIGKLLPYLEDKLFCEHRSNNLFRNKFHETTSVKNLRKVIDACDAQIKWENDICKNTIKVVI